ncbi:hypothetical protein HAU47_08720 [Weissella confusa]|uniref:hypothetical protein n=1 Tax=Weissella confusa TaxID=1583 RepID=UPI0002465AFC|nr:hypothetical protein [Weissella confusa]MBJ7616526.1 hypothetical protein [Weissella confusa]MBJ7620546.1 hypothetical protein [Weissella confusa]MBJ7641594.1 hypothetical protein [Weissella confusa]MBJ7655775.1 hypothetical protein [Weissella confusa]MBJ7667992.1 hypothetical protein [Weissella confusa]
MLTSFLVLEITALISLIWALKFKITKLTWITMLIVTILNAGYVYWLMPVPTLSQLVMPVAVESAIVVVWALITGASAQVVQRVTKRGTHISLEGLTIWPFIIPIVAFLISLGAGVSQALTVRPMYNSVQATVKKEAPLTKDDQPIALSAQASQNMMKKAFSQVPDSSMYRLGDLSAQYINGKPYYVAPVEFNGFMSWLMNRTLPGYFIISATDINDTAHFVKEKLDYSETSWFSHNIARKIYMRNPKYAQVGEPILEIDNNDQAYWVQTLLNVRWAGQLMYDDIHVSLTNADTGKTTVYSTKDLPAWVDAGVSPEAATRMNRAYGNPYAFNFRHKNQIKPTENGSESGVTPVFNNDRSISYFDDFTTVTSNADSDKGYSLISTRTGKLSFYTGKNVGIMDSDGAIKVAKQLHPQNKWHGSNPVIMNIDGTPTWVVSMMDQNERFREYAYIKGADQNVIGEGANASDALAAYRNALAGSVQTASANDASIKTESITGKVARVNANATLDDKQVVIFKLENDETMYTLDPSKMQNALLMQAGDDVTLKVKTVKGASVANVINLTNNSLK